MSSGIVSTDLSLYSPGAVADSIRSGFRSGQKGISDSELQRVDAKPRFVTTVWTVRPTKPHGGRRELPDQFEQPVYQ